MARMNSIRVVATMKAKAGKTAELEKLLNQVVSATHKEPGCQLYSLHRSAADPDMFVFVEKWANAADLDSHLKSPHIAAALARQEELIERLDIHPLDPLPKGLSTKENF
jgi:quinol monooxygenase YgiN